MGAYFPLFVDISGKRILVVGAGAIATRRAAVLADFGAKVTVVAPDGTDAMCGLVSKGLVDWKRRPFEISDLDGICLVAAATDDAALNSRIAALCRERKIPVNNAGDRSESDFYFPGVAREGELVAGVTASGNDHKLAKKAAEGLKKWLGEFTRGK